MAKTTYKDWEAEEKILLLQGWARNGLTNEQIASNMDIVVSTLWEWRKKSPKISNALKIGKDEADIQVENALYKAALEGNTTAMIFWLKNRRSKEWRDKIQQEITTESAVKLVIDNNELSEPDE
jgi:small terminase subunit|uniref:Terminase small subunit n=2 Tax=unclassified Caudoviricetes TaxID=2788787 RepID=A0A8S5NGF6_9CAUD|nr:MAG TPA: terminase small subunit [Podoviridae sp. ctUSJ1]DAE01235.1 MAG TPA: terminase small subunit [Podoviridae sp. ct3rL24]DAH57581.1 MAG TPA: terminase small subunit [Caudoviricetes sp.]DAT59668.1 MAG TPA: terminase small subunit [Caudoviricetes sp.]DAY35986.1 MAG TPA: terminase small subunit [Caudoviricetes sp.]